MIFDIKFIYHPSPIYNNWVMRDTFHVGAVDCWCAGDFGVMNSPFEGEHEELVLLAYSENGDEQSDVPDEFEVDIEFLFLFPVSEFEFASDLYICLLPSQILKCLGFVVVNKIGQIGELLSGVELFWQVLKVFKGRVVHQFLNETASFVSEEVPEEIEDNDHQSHWEEAPVDLDQMLIEAWVLVHGTRRIDAEIDTVEKSVASSHEGSEEQQECSQEESELFGFLSTEDNIGFGFEETNRDEQPWTEEEGRLYCGDDLGRVAEDDH